MRQALEARRMENRESIRRSDEQLKEMFEDPGTWIIHGSSQTFGVATTLRRALDKADTYARSGAIVVAIARPPPNRLFVFADQIARLARLLQEREPV
jgi:hypothetical protein